MMKRLLSVLRNSIFLSTILIFCLLTSNTYAKANVIYDSGDEKSGPIALPYNRLAVTGDSYAGLFCQFELKKAFILDGYALPGRTVLENKHLMISAMRGPNKLVLICIGVNDHYNATNPEYFEKHLRDVIEEGRLNNKIMFINSYVKYPLVNVRPGLYNILSYDSIVRNLANEYEELHYIEVNDIATFENSLDDNIHFNKKFYDGLYNRLIKIINSIDF